MSKSAASLFVLLVVGACALWLAVTWPLLQWTLAWLERRRDRALAEMERDA